MYKHSGLYDESHRLRYFSVEELIAGKKPSLPQSGVHEGGILCANCDNTVLGNLEQYAIKAIYGRGNLPAHECPECTNYVNAEGSTFAICTNLSYTKYKLFLLSILWRASISSKSFFNSINLCQQEEVLRQMILANDPKDYFEYPIFVITTASDYQFPADMIIQPIQNTDQHGMETCCFIIGGFIYIFKLGTFIGDNNELKEQTINEDNQLMILQLKEGQTMQLVKNYVGLE